MMNLLLREQPDRVLEQHELLSHPIQNSTGTLYHARYYPEAATLVCTVDLPCGNTSPGFYLVMCDGERISGGYQTAQVQFGIAKVIFDELQSDQFDHIEAVGPFAAPGEILASWSFSQSTE